MNSLKNKDFTIKATPEVAGIKMLIKLFNKENKLIYNMYKYKQKDWLPLQ